MGDSNADWGALSSHDDGMAEAWDGYSRLPEPGENPLLDAFVEAKRITIASLVRLGARMADGDVLAFAYDSGIKYRDIVTGKRWNWTGSTFKALKLVRGEGSSERIIVAEGETDAARLTILYPGADVAVLPAGARRWSPAFTAQLMGYRQVLVATDADEAGDMGAAAIMRLLPGSERLRPPVDPPHTDWCDLSGDPPELPDLAASGSPVVFGGDLLRLEVPDTSSWLDNDLLPIGGQLVIHGPPKSFKSWMAMDLMSAIATGQPWCCFEPTEEPAKVCVIQFEIAWPYYRDRCAKLRQATPEPELWDENFGTWTPLVRPTFAAGNTVAEDYILRGLEQSGAQVVLVDPIRRVMGDADFNSEQDVRRILGFFQRMQDEGLTVVATHHDRKEGWRTSAGDAVNMTGSGAFAGDADSIVSVWLPKGERPTDGSRRNLSFMLRNAPSPSPRGFHLVDSASEYQLDPHGEDEPGEDEPVI